MEITEDRRLTTVRGINCNLRPYSIEIVGDTAARWFDVLTTLNYYRRKALGVAPKEADV